MSSRIHRGKQLIYHLEEAAIGGHPDARYNLGFYECCKNENTERAVKHWIIAAAQGQNESTKALVKAFQNRCVSKEDLAAALRAHHAAIAETKSPQRQPKKYCPIRKSVLVEWFELSLISLPLCRVRDNCCTAYDGTLDMEWAVIL